MLCFFNLFFIFVLVNNQLNVKCIKKIVLFFNLVFFISFGILSCQKREEFNKKNIQKGRIFTNEQIDLIGEKHNEYLKFMLDNNLSSEDKFQGLPIQKQILEEKILNKNQNIHLSAMYSMGNKNEKKVKDHSKEVRNNLSDKNNFSYFQRVIDFLEKDENEKNVEAISNFIDNIKNEMVKSNVKDYEAFLVFCSVLKKSAEFWLPRKLERQNYYSFYKNDIKVIPYNMAYFEFSSSELSNNEEGWRKCLKDVLVSDGMSASAGFVIGAGVVAEIGGVTGPAFLVGIALESGAASAWEYYRSSNC